jgi:asparagine synthase (glutamine-hydrolysing)
MCRIAGIVNFHSPPTYDQIVQMRDAMQHGGPDDAGVYLDQQIPLAFGFRRLSFLDLSEHGHQPMTDVNGDVVLIFNGEIYNFQELKKELGEYSFQSTSDTEVIIYSYLKWGISCFQKFNGMFALAIWDKRKSKLILARDHAGIKPLYYSIKQDELYFASEVRAFKTLKPRWPENPDWKKCFLMFGHLPEPITTLQDVKPLPKGTTLEIELPSFKTTSTTFYRQYYNYSITSEQEAIEKIKEALTASVHRHLISDAPIGLFLSGGIDSSLLTILAKKFIPDNLQTLSIDFESEQYSERKYQDIVIKETGANHKTFIVTDKLFYDHLDDIINAMDQPSNDGINTYFVCKFAKSYGLKAALSGLGADELFGGYQSFYRANAMKKFKWLLSLLNGAVRILPDDRKRKLEFLKTRGATGEYLFNRGFFIPSQVAMLLDCNESEVRAALERIVTSTPDFVEKLRPIEKVSFVETNFYLQNQLLKDTDYMGMWHGLEVRVPFLDKELMNAVYSISPEIRYSPSQIKHLLIASFKDILPESIWDRTKQGFTFPFAQWMKNIEPVQMGAKSASMKYRMENDEIHWSRYWSYILTQRF